MMKNRASKRRKQNLQEDNESDRIRARSLDDFPEDILKHILTFLPTVDAVRTSLLSRKWRRRKLWGSLPFLDLDYSHFPLTPDDDPSDACIRFAEFIDQTLKRRSRFPIQKFRLHFDYTASYFWKSILDKWISYVISHKVTDLDIGFSKTCPYEFDFVHLKNSHVQNVRVSSCDIVPHGMSYLNLDLIRSVSLFNVILTDDMVVELISWCNNLESLALEYCRRMKRLRICSSKLKDLSLVENWGASMEESWGSLLDEGEGLSLEIWCPNLCSLRISDFKMNKYFIKDSPALVEADVHFFDLDDEPRDFRECWSKVVRLLTGVKRLTTQNDWFKLLCKKDASLDCFVFENLNHLELWTGNGQRDLLGMAALLKICPNITTLTLNFSYRSKYNGWVSKEFVDKPIEFSIPNLKILNLENSKDAKIDMLVELMKKHGAALEKIVLWERKNGKRYSIPLYMDHVSV